jgi:hypothetical protein
MRTIVHIGQHKTATTSIQHLLGQFRSAFCRHGLYVPDSIAGFTNRSHFILNVYALDQDRYSFSKENLLKTRSRDYLSGLGASIKEDVAKHYQRASESRCRDVIWTNEGLYTLNSVEEYARLRSLFEAYSSRIVCVCCFRDVASFRKSYIQQMVRNGYSSSDDPNYWRYVAEDSWLFDYERKTRLLRQVFDEVVTFPYDPADNVGAFFASIGYRVPNTRSLRLNVSD